MRSLVRPQQVQTHPNVAATRQPSIIDGSDPSDEETIAATDPTEAIPHIPNQPLDLICNMAADLFEQNIIGNLKAQTIQAGLAKHCHKKVSEEQARIVSKILTSRLEETC